jgi:glycosyltransferase involved in cell wall biosynthesis
MAIMSGSDRPVVRSVALLARRFHPSIGGVERYLRDLGEALADRGIRVYVLADNDNGRLAARERLGAIEVRRFAMSRSRLRAWGSLARLAPLLRRVDVLHVSDVWMLEYYYRIIARLVGPRTISLTRHGISVRDPIPESERLRSRRARAWCDVLFDDGYFIEKRIGVTPDAVPNQGLNPPASAIPQTPEPAMDSAVFLGRLDTDTGLEIYLEAMAALRDRHGIDMWLTVYGDGPCAASLKDLADRLRVRVVWHCAHPDARDRITDHGLAFVSGRMAIQEAMARRRLVAAAYIDPLRRDYVCGEPFSPFIVKGSTGPALADAIVPFLRDHEARQRFVEAAYAHALQLTWGATASVYIDHWQGMLAADSRRTDALTRRSIHEFARELTEESREAMLGVVRT